MFFAPFALFFSCLQAMDVSTIKTIALQQRCSGFSFVKLFQKQVEGPYRILTESEIFSQSDPHQRIKRHHVNNTIYSGLNPILVLYAVINNKKQSVFLGNPFDFLTTDYNISVKPETECVALIHAETKIFTVSPSKEIYLIELFNAIKKKLDIENMKQCWIETSASDDKQQLAVILKENPDDSYALLQDGQIINFNRF